MTGSERTRRQRLRERLDGEPHTLAALVDTLGASPEALLADLEQLGRSLEHEAATLLVAPPTCRDCGFDGFDDPANRPARCPACNSEAVDDPTFVVR